MLAATAQAVSYRSRKEAEPVHAGRHDRPGQVIRWDLVMSPLRDSVLFLSTCPAARVVGYGYVHRLRQLVIAADSNSFLE